jgi:phage/plasmid-associated DNA primase
MNISQNADSFSKFFKDTQKPSFLIRDINKKSFKGELKIDEHSRFWAFYCDAVKLNEYSSLSENIEEIHQEIMPFAIKLSPCCPKKIYPDLVHRIQNYFVNNFVFDSLSDNSPACIITCNQDNTNLYFPLFKLPYCDMKDKYMPDFIDYMSTFDEYKDYKFEELYGNGSSPLYGSGDEKYVACFDDISDPDETREEASLSAFEYEAHTKIEQGLINLDDLAKSSSLKESQRDELYWLPLILSINYWRSITYSFDKTSKLIEESEKEFKEYKLENIVYPECLTDNLMTNDNYIMFLSMWDPNRIVNQKYWKIVGEAYYTLFSSNSRGLCGWIAVINSALESARPNSYLSRCNVRRVCTTAYSSFRESGIDVKTLAWYAKIDSPKEYSDWFLKWTEEADLCAMTGKEVDVGRSFYRHYWLDYMTCNVTQKPIFYKFKNHKLIRDYAGISLRIKMSNDFIQIFYRIRANVCHQQRQTATKQALTDEAIDRITLTINALKSQSFKKRLLEELSEKFHVENIHLLIDQNPELTLVKNGVICASSTDIFFRDGKPQDYLIKSFSASYRQDYTWDHPQVRELLNWSFITFIDQDTIKYHWKFLASLLRGGNNDKKVMFWSGKIGGNMKTTWQRFVADILGEKCISMPVNYFTKGKGEANGATPAEVRLDGCRMMFSEEPEEKVPFLVSVIKSCSGNEKVYIRGLFQEGREIIPQHKVVIVVNTMPPIGGNKEGALEERIVVTPFESIATYGAPDNLEEQIKQRNFPRDPFFDRKLPGLSDAGLWIMYNMYPEYIVEGIRNKPKDVARITEEYWASIDRYNIFIKEFVVKDEDESIDSYELYPRFSRWHELSYKKLDVPDRTSALEEFSKKFGSLIDGAWHGYMLKALKK